MNAQVAQYADVKKVAQALDCHVSTVWRMAQRGDIPAPVKIGNLTRWEVRKLSPTVQDGAA